MKYNRQTPCIYPNLKVVFHGIPKNASTTIKNALYELENGYQFHQPNKQWIHKGNEKGGSTYPSIEEIKTGSFKDWIHLAVVRDPYDRFCSFYLDLFKQSTGLRPEPPPFYRANNIDMNMDVNGAIDLIEKYDDEIGEEHFVSQHTYLYVPIDGIFLMPIEFLKSYWKLFCKAKLGVDPPELTMYNQSNDELILNKTQQKRIAKRYQKDFEELGYVP